MSFPVRQSVERCLAARPSTSSAEAPQATTTARVNTGEKPRRLARVTIRRGPCRRTSASAITRLTGGVRSVAGIGARIETQPFPGWFGKRGCGRTRLRNAGRSNCTSRPSAYDPSGHMGIWQYPFELIRDISASVSAAAPRRGDGVDPTRNQIHRGSRPVGRDSCLPAIGSFSLSQALPRSSYSEITATLAADGEPSSNS